MKKLLPILLICLIPAFVYSQTLPTTQFPNYVNGLTSGAGGVSSTDVLPIVRSSVAKKITWGDLTAAAGDVTATTVTITKTGTTAGQSCMYDGGFAELYGDCWEGSTPGGALGAWRLYKLPAADSTGDQVMVWSVPSAGRSTATWVTPLTVAQKFTQCTTIKDPTADSDHQVFRAGVAMTVTNVHCLAIGGTSLTGSLQECDANGANCAGVDGATTMTCAAGSNVNDDGALSNPSIDAGDYIKWVTASVSGTQTELIVCFDYTMP